MSQIFTADGEVIPVSLVKVGPCAVLEKKSATGKDGYSALKLGFETKREKLVTKPAAGYFAKLSVPPCRFVREVRLPEEQLANYEVGATLGADLFEAGDFVTVSGNSKGRGFAGVYKRWGMGGCKATHGTHKYFRHGGATGAHTWPGRVRKGKHMPGQYGNTLQTIQNLEVVKVLPEDNILMVRGAVPGHRNTLLMVQSSKKKWKRG
jgi:large subunit ribosomal protein L3